VYFLVIHNILYLIATPLCGEKRYMQESEKMHRSSLLRNSITVLLLPIIIFIWMTSWILTQIGEVGKSTEISQKTLRADSRFEVPVEESEVSEEDSKIDDYPQVVGKNT
jgi:hypothetical protein